MSKTISSAFMLLLILIILWGISSWIVGNQNKESLKTYLESNQSNINSFYKISVLETSSTILGSKAKVILNLNTNNEVSSLFKESLGELLLNIDIKNGPILFNKSGLSFGKSAWEISFNKDSSDTESNSPFTQKDITAYLNHSFADVIEYTIPLDLNISNILINGYYDINKSHSKGSITSDKFTFNNNKYLLQSNNLDLKYIIIDEAINNLENSQKLYIKSTLPNVFFKHINMRQNLNLKTEIDGHLFLKGNEINSVSNISFKNANKSTYPIDNVKFNFKVSDLNLLNVSKFINDLSEVNNLKQQAQWVLEEQGELPEGQDQIWQLQDQINRFETSLVNTASKVINNENEKMPVFNFSLVNQYQGKQSKLYGKIDSISETLSVNELSDLSFFSLTQVKANVTLDELVFTFLSGQIPIKKKQFNLRYKQNKLLMQ